MTDATDSTINRRERGIAAYARQFDMDEDDVPTFMSEGFGALMAEEAFHSAGGASWDAPGLTPRDRSIAIIATLVTLGGVESRLRSHVRLALREGITGEGLEALTVLLASYAGFPRASVAVEIIRQEVDMAAKRLG